MCTYGMYVYLWYLNDVIYERSFSGYLENVHQAIVDIIPSSKTFCSLELSWKLGKKENFVLYFFNETKIDLDYEPQCTKTL